MIRDNEPILTIPKGLGLDIDEKFRLASIDACGSAILQGATHFSASALRRIWPGIATKNSQTVSARSAAARTLKCSSCMLLAARLTRIPNLPRRAMGSTAFAAYAAQSGSSDSQRTVTALSRWSIINKQLPAVDKIKAIHIYDFDNTRKPSPF